MMPTLGAREIPSLGPALAASGLALVVAVLFGLASATGSLLLVAAVGAPLALAATLALRIEHVVILLLLAASVIGGALAYFGRVGQAQWLPAGIGLVLYLHLLLQRIRSPGQWRSPPALMVLTALFAILAVGSTLWSGSDLVAWLYGLRHYFALASLMFVLALLPLEPCLIDRLWKLALLVVLVQPAVAAYQYFFVGSARLQQGLGGEAWDAVVGTMGGSQEGGGHSAALGFFVVAGFVVALTLWKRGSMRAWQVAVLGLTALSTIFLAEVKFMALLMPLAVLLALRGQFLRRISLMVAGLLVIVAVVAGMPVLYSKLHYERSGRPPVSAAEFYGQFLNSVEPNLINRQTGEMGRGTQIVFWADQHDIAREPKELLIGHGMASTNLSRIGVGDVARRYLPTTVGTNTGVLLLWEVGLIGLTVAILALLVGSRQSFVFARQDSIPVRHRAYLEAGAILLLLSVPMLFYKHLALKSAAVQFLLFLSAGQVLFWQARMLRAGRYQG